MRVLDRHTGPVAKGRSLAEVDEPVLARAQGVVEWIDDCCRQRGYALTLDPDDAGRLTVLIGEDAFELLLTEEWATVDEVAADVQAKAKYDWQRVPVRQVQRPSGRLRIDLVDRLHPLWCADRRRRSILDKLPEVLAELAARADKARALREEREEEHRKRVAFWEASVERAKANCRAQWISDYAQEQAARWAKARDLRAYAQAILLDPRHGVDPAALAWADALQAEADRIDPLAAPAGDLVPREPDAFTDDELDRFMPRGLTVAYPPSLR